MARLKQAARPTVKQHLYLKPFSDKKPLLASPFESYYLGISKFLALSIFPMSQKIFYYFSCLKVSLKNYKFSKLKTCQK